MIAVVYIKKYFT